MTPTTWAQVEEALAKGWTVREYEGDLVVSVEPADPPRRDSRRVNWVAAHKVGRLDAVPERYTVDTDSLHTWTISETPSPHRVPQEEVDAAIRSAAQAFGPVERAHLVDDHEAQRTAGLRPAREARDLLGDARDALAAGHTEVALELVERAIARVDKSIKALTAKAQEASK